MNLKFIFIACFIVLGFVGVRAINKKVCVVYSDTSAYIDTGILYIDGRHQKVRNIQIFVVQDSEKFAYLGTDSVINKDWDRFNVRANVQSDRVERLQDDTSRLHPKGKTPIVALVTEITQTEEQDIGNRGFASVLAGFAAKRWYRVHTKEVKRLGETGFTYEADLMAYEKVVCFVHVQAFGEKVNQGTPLGSALFLESSGEFYTNWERTEIQDGQIEVSVNQDFEYTNHCKPGEMIAVKYGKINSGTTEFAEDWEYYKLGELIPIPSNALISGKSPSQGFKIVRVCP